MIDFIDLLAKQKKLPMSTINMVLSFCEQWGTSIFHALLETHIFNESELADFLASTLKLDRLFVVETKINSEALSQFIPYKQACRWECFPTFYNESSSVLEVIIADPTRSDRMDWMSKHSKQEVRFAISERSNILRAINEYYPISSQMVGRDHAAATPKS